MWLAVLLLTLLVFYVVRRVSAHRSNLPPGPFNIPLLGSWEFLKLYLCNGSLSEMYERLGKKYGPVVFMRIAMDTPVVAIRTYDVIKEASRDMALAGINIPVLYRLMNDWKNYGVSFSEGTNWVNNRKLTQATVSKLGFTKKNMDSLIAHECTLAVEKLSAKSGQVVHIEKELVTAVSNIIFQLTMSKRFDLEDLTCWEMKNDSVAIFNIVAQLQTYIDLVPWLRRFTTHSSDYKTLDRIMQRFYVFADQVIEEHLATLDDNNPRDMVDSYLVASRSKHAGHATSTADLRVLIKDLIVAGMDAPSVMLSWSLLLMADRPAVQDRVRAEVDAVVGPDRAPTLDDEQRCPYTRAFIDEMLRFVSVTPFNRHFASQSSTTLRGHHIPVGSVVLVDLHSLHHDPAVWGDPEVFRPERFLEVDPERATFLRQHVRGFGFSPRVCPAEQYARSLLFLFIAGLLQRLTFRLPAGQHAVPNAQYSVGIRPGHMQLIPQPRG